MAKAKRKAPERSRTRLSADDAAILAAIESLRSDPGYRAAEALRRKRSGGLMAQAPEGSEEHKAIRILIATWISIGTLMKGAKAKDPFFRLLPICNMYKALREEIEYLRKTLDADDFARELFELQDEWEAWLEKQGLSSGYVTALCGGLTAKFG